MKSRLPIASLISLLALLGCTVSPTSNPAPPLTGSWQNWQIQAGTAITSPPNTYPYFLGAVQTSGTQSAAVFAAVTESPNPTAQVLDFLGTYNSSTGAVDLLPAASGPDIFAIGFTPPSTPNTQVPVGVTGGCVYPLNYQGAECGAITSAPSVGVQIAPLNGTYVGTLNDGTPSMSGTATLTLTQTATPNSSGQFPLSGTITFPSGSGFGTVPLGGTLSGEGIALSDSSAAPNSPTANLTAAASPDGSQITVTNLLYSNFGPGAVFIYTGTLVRQ